MTSIKTHPKPPCPDCGAQMKLKRPRPGQMWKPFWGCSQFVYGDPSSCQGKTNIGIDGSPESDEWKPGDFD